jgi:hypothetical protein
MANKATSNSDGLLQNAVLIFKVFCVMNTTQNYCTTFSGPMTYVGSGMILISLATD